MINARGELAAVMATVTLIPLAWLMWKARQTDGLRRDCKGSLHPASRCD
jgi:hypothetical protein